METLDLHGVRYYEVDRLVENFVLLQDPPLRIITGNSPMMHSLTIQVLDRHSFSWQYENDYNLGAIVITSS